MEDGDESRWGKMKALLIARDRLRQMTNDKQLTGLRRRVFGSRRLLSTTDRSSSRNATHMLAASRDRAREASSADVIFTMLYARHIY